MEQELEAYLTTLQAGVRRHEAEVAAMQASFDEVGRVRQLMTRLPDKVGSAYARVALRVFSCRPDAVPLQNVSS